MKRFAILLNVFLLIALMVSVAYAIPPVKETYEGIDEDPFFFYCGDDIGVGDFYVALREEYRESYVTHYDKDGNLIKEAGHASGIDYLYVDGYPEKVLSGNFVLNWTLYPDPETGEWVLSFDRGLPWNIQLPGYGNIIHFSGTTTWLYDPDIGDWEAIKDAGLRHFDPVPLCEYLAPPA